MLECLRPPVDLPANVDDSYQPGGERRREESGGGYEHQFVNNIFEEVGQREDNTGEELSPGSSEGQGTYDCSSRDKDAKSVFRLHACWVKAGHDLLQERTSFVLSLLHKVC